MKKITLIVLIIVNQSFCQKKEINLPKGFGFKIEYSNYSITPILNTYVTKKGKVTFENINLPIEKLGDTVFKYINKQPEQLILNVQSHIYGDKKTPYKYIEAVKTQLGRGSSYKVLYRTDNFADITKGLIVRLGKSLVSEIKAPIDKNSIIMDLPIILDPIQDIVDNLYDLQFDKAKKGLKNYKYCKINFYSSKKVIINGMKISLKDEDKIYNVMKGNDFFFVFTDENLCYQDYIKNLSLITKSYKKHEKYIDLIDISLELEKKLKENNIKL